MIPRVLEPEVMDSREEAVDYDSMDHSHVNRVFVDDFLAAWNSGGSDQAAMDRVCLDTGAGTAQIPIELCSRPGTDWTVVAADLSGQMLRVGRRNCDAADVAARLLLIHSDCKRLPVASQSCTAVMSNSIVHHIPDPLIVFREMVRVVRPHGLLFVRDLMRPETAADVDRLVETYAGDENEHQRQMFHDSLHAALTLDEVRSCLSQLELPADWATATTDRHWTVSGWL